jgi:hypothetical protein
MTKHIELKAMIAQGLLLAALSSATMKRHTSSPKNPNADDHRRFVAVVCEACGLTHMINRATGRAMGEED